MSSAVTMLTLPWPVSVNHLWVPIAKYNAKRRTWYGTLVLSEAATAYYTEAGWDILSQRPLPSPWPYQGPVTFLMEVTPPNAGKHDLDNVMKIVLDVLVKTSVLQDDSLIEEIHLFRRRPRAPGTLAITLTPGAAG